MTAPGINEHTKVFINGHEIKPWDDDGLMANFCFRCGLPEKPERLSGNLLCPRCEFRHAVREFVREFARSLPLIRRLVP